MWGAGVWGVGWWKGVGVVRGFVCVELSGHAEVRD